MQDDRGTAHGCQLLVEQVMMIIDVESLHIPDRGECSGPTIGRTKNGH